MLTILKIVLVAVLIVAMVMVLLLIRYISNPGESATQEDNLRLRHDVETRDRVITNNSIFHQFFARPTRNEK